MQVEIIPAVLPKSFKDLEEHLLRIKGAVKTAQIDVVDGSFAHNKTWPYKDAASFERIVAEEHGLPLWDELDFQFDLMIDNPAERIMDFVHAGASQIILHAKSAGAADALQQLVDLREEGGAFSIKAGLAILPDSQPEELERFEAQFDFVQVMGIARVGFQGEPWDKRALYLLERLRRRYPGLPLQVDGGVSMDNAQALAKAGANRLVAGSAIFKADDPVQAIADLKAEANRI
ncbi:MAG: hypothetical protein KGH79_00310 [Patescibacteria group bacterium]|nr:hypothetical protein [Patescibacteria group bacterium]